jgi:hypothetical protein
MEYYKTLIKYAQTHPKANGYLKEVMKDSIAEIVRFRTESGMVEPAAVDDTNSRHPQSSTGYPMPWVCD